MISLPDKENEKKVTECSLISNWFVGKTHAEQPLSVDGKKALGRNLAAVAIVIILAFIIAIYHPHVNTTSLVTYNALVIAAVIFLLNFHFGELRDVSSWYIGGKPTANHSIELFSFWHENKSDMPAAVKVVEVKALFITVLLISIIFLMVSSFIVIASIKALDILAFVLSIISSVGILTILIGTFCAYLKSAKEYARKYAYKHPYKNTKVKVYE